MNQKTGKDITSDGRPEKFKNHIFLEETNMKRKLLVGMMSALLVAGMAVPVGATGSDPNDSLDVKYSLNSSYTLNIPATVTLAADGGSTSVGVSAVNTAPTEKVQIKISSGINESNQVTLTRDGDNTTKVVSEVTDSQKKKLSNGSIVAEFQDMDTTAITGAYGDGTLNFGAIADSSGGTVKAGSYTGTIVFEAGIVARNATGGTGE